MEPFLYLSLIFFHKCSQNILQPTRVTQSSSPRNPNTALELLCMMPWFRDGSLRFGEKEMRNLQFNLRQLTLHIASGGKKRREKKRLKQRRRRGVLNELPTTSRVLET